MKYMLSEIARICGGELIGEDLPVARVLTDSRNCSFGEEPLFVAMKGTNHDSQNRQKGTELSAKQVVDAHRQQITESHFHRSFLFFLSFQMIVLFFFNVLCFVFRYICCRHFRLAHLIVQFLF